MRTPAFTTIRPKLVNTVALTVVFLVSACGGDEPAATTPKSAAPAPAASTSAPTVAPISVAPVQEASAEAQADAPAASDERAVPDIAIKSAGSIDFPAIPQIVVPDIVGVGPAQESLEASMKALIDPIQGITVKPARCGADRALINDAGVTSVDGNGTLTRVGDSGIFKINADGTGRAVFEGGVFEVKPGGAGSLVREGEIIRVDGKGQGEYTGSAGIIKLDGKGAGRYSGSGGSITVNGDGSGTWSSPEQGIITIKADGSGSWIGGPDGIVRNLGDGTGTINGESVKMSPIPPVPPAGTFPGITGFVPPGAPCGVLITLNDRLLFDFDQSELREEAASILDQLAPALAEINNSRIEVRGHTDHVGSDAYNQTLSQARAETVRTALEVRKVQSAFSAKGFGESQPLAPNVRNINGVEVDNPSGRQLNRRVEIFIQSS